jgi:hypothetical protein
MSQPPSNTRIAVEFLTLWMESDRRGAAKHISMLLNDPEEPETAEIVAGLLNLNMLILFELAKAHGATDKDMRQKAGEILRDLSQQLPE